MIGAELVYVLGAALSAVCAALLARADAGNGVRLLLWSGLCFAGFAVNNLLLFVGATLGPAYDLSAPRALAGVLALALLLHGLVWEAPTR